MKKPVNKTTESELTREMITRAAAKASAEKIKSPPMPAGNCAWKKNWHPLLAPVLLIAALLGALILIAVFANTAHGQDTFGGAFGTPPRLQAYTLDQTGSNQWSSEQVILANSNAERVPTNGAAVPEPGIDALLLLVLGILFFCECRRNRWRERKLKEALKLYGHQSED